MEPTMDDDMMSLVCMMRVSMGRWPTEDEVYNFIMGDDAEKERILKDGADVRKSPSS